MRYALAIRRIGKRACPSCECPADVRDGRIGHRPHCGIGLFDRRAACNTRKNACARFCVSCDSCVSCGTCDSCVSCASCGTPENLSLAD